jgi:hypothetical protein
MRLELRPDEVAVLRDVISHHLSELRMEIAGTERLSWREPMHREEELLKSLLVRLGAEDTGAEEPPAESQGRRGAGETL